MLICQSCNTAIPDGSAFCLNCGARVGENTAPTAAAPAPQRQAAPRLAAPRTQWDMDAFLPPADNAVPDGREQRQGKQSRQGGQGKGGKKTRTMVVILLLVVALAVIATVVVLLVQVLQRPKTTGGFDDPNRVPALDPNPAYSAPSMAAKEPDGPFTWLVEPSLEYDSMQPVMDYTHGGAADGYVNITKNGQTGTVRMSDGKEVFALHDGAALMICDMGFAHNLPPDIEAMATDEMKSKALSDRGFPFATHGGHGMGEPVVWGRSPDGSQMRLGVLGFGYFTPLEAYGEMGGYQQQGPALVVEVDFFEGEEFTDLTYEVGFEPLYGLASASGEMLLDIAYEAIEFSSGDVCILRQGGRFGYYSTQTGTQITPCIYEGMWADGGPWGVPGWFAGGYCPVKLGGKVGYINAAGQVAVELQFGGGTQVKDGKAWVQSGGKWGQIAINSEGSA